MNSTPATTWANSSSTESMCGEWKAWLTVSFRIRRPRSRQASASSRTTSASPESTTERGPFTAASDTAPSRPASSGSTSSSVASTATIAPPERADSINRPRAATSTAASSRENAPAT